MTITINGTTGIAGVDGSAGTPAVQGADINTGMFFPAADTIAFAEGGAEVARFDSSGNLGIGTTTSLSKLTALGTTSIVTNGASTRNPVASLRGGNDNNRLDMYVDSSGGTAIMGLGAYNVPGGATAMTFYTGASVTEQMRIDTSGNVGIGTTSPSTYGQLAVYTAASNTEVAAVTGGANYCTFSLRNSSKRYSMQIRTDQSNAWVLRDETAGANRITVRDSDGVLFVPSVYATTNAAAANVYVGSDGSIVRSTSSLKYKKDVQDATHGLADVLKLRSVTYKGKSESNGDTVFGGFIAEEVDALGLTEFVQYADDESPDALAYGNMVALLTKAIQEQQALITALTARITALETAP